MTPGQFNIAYKSCWTVLSFRYIWLSIEHHMKFTKLS